MIDYDAVQPGCEFLLEGKKFRVGDIIDRVYGTLHLELPSRTAYWHYDLMSFVRNAEYIEEEEDNLSDNKCKMTFKCEGHNCVYNSNRPKTCKYNNKGYCNSVVAHANRATLFIQQLLQKENY